jgi:cysteine sulfinate desulfinase/cysteine desulfurase-like protein
MKYFDSNANYPVSKKTAIEYLKWLKFHNISSLTADSHSGDEVIDQHRKTTHLVKKFTKFVHRNYGVEWLIIYTSGASESNSTVINHFMYESMLTQRKPIFACPMTSHASTSIYLSQLEKDGLCSVIWMKTDSLGNIIPENIECDCMFIQSVNSETGCKQKVEQIAKLCKGKVAVDDVQGFCKSRFDAAGCDYVTASAHKIGGMIGFGILMAKKPIHAMIAGKQNHGMRGGTYNIAGLAAAMKAIEVYEPDNAANRFRRKLARVMRVTNIEDFGKSPKTDKEFVIVGDKSSLPHVIFGFQLRGNTVVCGDMTKQQLLAKDILIGTGSACNNIGKDKHGSMTSVTLHPDPNVDAAMKSGFIRLSFSNNSNSEVDELVQELAAMEA